MSFLDSSSAVLDCILTRKGRELLAKNDGSFKISKFSFADDEINYGLFDISNPSNPDINILNQPISEPVSNEAIAMRSRLITLPIGSTKVATLSVKPRIATVGYGDILNFTVNTENGEDPQGYSGSSRDTDIAIFNNIKELPNANGVASFSVLTGTNAGGKSGEVVLDIIAVNTGARGTLTLTVSASGT